MSITYNGCTMYKMPIDGKKQYYKQQLYQILTQINYNLYI